MNFIKVEKKGLNLFLVDTQLPENAFSIHISALEPGATSHAPHSHVGMEAFYVFHGELTLKQNGQKTRLTQNEACATHAAIPHSVTNTGSERNKYMVMIAKP